MTESAWVGAIATVAIAALGYMTWRLQRALTRAQTDPELFVRVKWGISTIPGRELVDGIVYLFNTGATPIFVEDILLSSGQEPSLYDPDDKTPNRIPQVELPFVIAGYSWRRVRVGFIPTSLDDKVTVIYHASSKREKRAISSLVPDKRKRTSQ